MPGVGSFDLEDCKLDASIIPKPLLEHIAESLRTITGTGVEYVSVTYKLQDHNPVSVVLRTHDYDREMPPRQNSGPSSGRKRDAAAAKRGSSEGSEAGG